MKIGRLRIGIVAGLLALACAVAPARAQQKTDMCLIVTSSASGSAVQSCQDVSTSNPFPVTIPGTVTISGTVTATLSTGTTGGATPGNEIAPNNTTGILLSAGAHTVYGAQLGNIGSIPAYLKLYDKATAPTCGSDTPIKRLIIPAASTAANGGGSNVPMPYGVAVTLGLGYCVTTGITDADTTAPTANQVLVNIDYK